jgi:signal transduction histidine kinase
MERPAKETPGIVDRLTTHRLLGEMPRGELEWLAEHGTVLFFPAGAIIARKGDPLTHLYVVLAGSFVMSLELASGRTALLETHAGDVTALLPYTRATSIVGDVRVTEDMEILAIPKDLLPGMIRECPRIVERLVHRLIDRARTHSSAHMQDERLKSLGRLAAGLAHELDNPASAALRAARSLHGVLQASAAAATALEAARLTTAQREALDHARQAARRAATYSALERADRHDALADWLDARGADGEIADALADTAVDTTTLDRLAGSATGETLGCMLRALAAERAAVSLAGGIESAVSRIHEIVSSVRRFTSLGRAPGATERLDLARGLRDVVAVHAAKATAKSARISLTVAEGLPAILAGDELNQAWADLLDNAIDAVGESGEVQVRAAVEHEEVVVRVIDDGPGIPPEVEARMFEPFFTTKPQGQGLGLGLDTVRRIVLANDGRIAAESRPGRTEFRVSLPIAEGRQG